MRVLLSAFACAPGAGSEPGVGWHWAIGIARLGHEVVVLTQQRDRAAIEAWLHREGAPAGLRFVHLMPAWLDRLAERGLPLQLVHLAWQWLAYRHARSMVADDRFDLVHHITYCGIRQASFMGGLPIPFVLGPVGGGESGPLALRRGMGVRGWLLDALRDGLNLIARVDPITRRSLVSARLIYVSSPDTARLVPAAHRHKVRVHLQIGIDPPDQDDADDARRSAEGPLRLVYVGRCLVWKGMHLGLAALAELRARDRDARLTMVGAGSAERLWRRTAVALGLENAVEWRSWVEHARMAAVYRSHDALLFPSLHDSGGQAVLEALAHGVPVVCLDLGGPGTMVDASCGRVVATGCRNRAQVVTGLADALQELADSADLRARLGAGGRTRARQFVWSRQIGEAYAEIEAVVLGDRSSMDDGSRSGATPASP